MLYHLQMLQHLAAFLEVVAFKHKILKLLLPGSPQFLLEDRILGISTIWTLFQFSNTSLAESMLALRAFSGARLLIVSRLDYREADRTLMVVYPVLDLRQRLQVVGN
jgi:carbon starvation protein CstA